MFTCCGGPKQQDVQDESVNVDKTLQDSAGNPKLIYFPFSGRGEFSRLIAAAGGVTLDNEVPPDPRADLCASHGAVGTGLPLLTHGDVKMCQSQAIQGYLALISPKFSSLSPAARGVDLMWSAHLEDMIQEVFKSGIGGVLFGGGLDALTDDIKANLKATLEKWFRHFEKLSPEDGFVNKEAFPTAADCVATYLYNASAPWKACFALSEFDPAAYPKFKALADRADAAPGLKEYIESSASLPMNPFAAFCQAKSGYEAGDAPEAAGEPYPDIKYGLAVPERLTGDKMEKKMKKIIKEGGKRGVEIEGAADMGGLQFFCTTMIEPAGDADMLYESMRAMNEKSDPTEEERKGGSGRIGKLLTSVNQDNTKLALVTYCPPSKHAELKADQWMQDLLKELGGGECVFGDAFTAKAVIENNAEKGLFVLKLKDNAISTAINYLKGKGLFPDKTDDSDDEMIFGDEDFPS